MSVRAIYRHANAGGLAFTRVFRAPHDVVGRAFWRLAQRLPERYRCYLGFLLRFSTGAVTLFKSALI